MKQMKTIMLVIAAVVLLSGCSKQEGSSSEFAPLIDSVRSSSRRINGLEFSSDSRKKRKQDFGARRR